MLAPRHITKKVKGDYRLIAISDIHGHLQYLKALLRKVKYDPDLDYLVIIGDYIEKGEDMETIVCDYIAGMTDNYAVERAKEIFIPISWQS